MLEFKAVDGSALLDTPGLNDTNGVNVRLVNSASLQQALQRLESAKFLYVVNYPALASAGGKGRFFTEMLQTVRLFANGQLSDEAVRAAAADGAGAGPAACAGAGAGTGAGAKAQAAASVSLPGFLSHFLFVFARVPAKTSVLDVQALLDDYVEQNRRKNVLSPATHALVAHIRAQLGEHKDALLVDPVGTKPSTLLDVLRQVPAMERPATRLGSFIDPPTMTRLQAECDNAATRIAAVLGHSERGGSSAAALAQGGTEEPVVFFVRGARRGVPPDDFRVRGNS